MVKYAALIAAVASLSYSFVELYFHNARVSELDRRTRETRATLRLLMRAADAYQDEHGSRPRDMDELVRWLSQEDSPFDVSGWPEWTVASAKRHRDEWGRTVLLRPTANGHRVFFVSAGDDGIFSTISDLDGLQGDDLGSGI